MALWGRFFLLLIVVCLSLVVPSQSFEIDAGIAAQQLAEQPCEGNQHEDNVIYILNGAPFVLKPDACFTSLLTTHTNAEAHQHPWLATVVSMTILLVMIFGIINCSNSMGG